MQVVYPGDIDSRQRLGQEIGLLLVVALQANSIAGLQDRFEESDEVLRVDKLAGGEMLAGFETFLPVSTLCVPIKHSIALCMRKRAFSCVHYIYNCQKRNNVYFNFDIRHFCIHGRRTNVDLVFLSEHMRGGSAMIISGVAMLALCTLLGSVLGDLLGMALGVKANVGGVGIAMILLIATRLWLNRRGLLTLPLKLGVEFWGALYIPIVVAMAAQQNVLVAARSGPLVLIAGIVTVFVCFATVALMSRIGERGETMDEIEARAKGELAASGNAA
jgi:malonate transporter MadL subunit